MFWVVNAVLLCRNCAEVLTESALQPERPSPRAGGAYECGDVVLKLLGGCFRQFHIHFSHRVGQGCCHPFPRAVELFCLSDATETDFGRQGHRHRFRAGVVPASRRLHARAFDRQCNHPPSPERCGYELLRRWSWGRVRASRGASNSSVVRLGAYEMQSDGAPTIPVQERSKLFRGMAERPRSLAGRFLSRAHILRKVPVEAACRERGTREAPLRPRCLGCRHRLHPRRPDNR